MGSRRRFCFIGVQGKSGLNNHEEIEKYVRFIRMNNYGDVFLYKGSTYDNFEIDNPYGGFQFFIDSNVSNNSDLKYTINVIPEIGPNFVNVNVNEGSYFAYWDGFIVPWAQLPKTFDPINKRWTVVNFTLPDYSPVEAVNYKGIIKITVEGPDGLSEDLDVPYEFAAGG